MILDSLVASALPHPLSVRDQNSLRFSATLAIVDTRGNLYVRDPSNDSDDEIAWMAIDDGEPVFTSADALGKRCSVDCAGWFLDADGLLHVCRACGRFKNTTEASDAITALLNREHHDSTLEGWALFDSNYGFMLQRDDDSDGFETDRAALDAAIEYFRGRTGCNVGPR